MYTLLRAMQFLGGIIAVMAIIVKWANEWQKKNDKENANYYKGHNKMLRTFGFLSFAAFLVATLMLYLKMY